MIKYKLYVCYGKELVFISMEINTRYFGVIEYQESDVIKFPVGIVGFEEYSDYILLRFAEDNQVMFCLQGIDEQAPVFIVFNPFEIVKDYEPILSETDMEELKCTSDENVDYYVIAKVGKSMQDTVVNLKSPIAINLENKLAKQIVMDKYELRCSIFEKTEE